MCLTPIHSIPFIVEKDILCKKRLIKFGNYLYTPYQSIPVTFNNGICIQIAPYFSFNEFGDILEGIHSYSKWRTGLPSDLMYQCIIPKGTEFYIGNHDDLVSLKLIIFKNRFRYWIYKIFHK